VLPSGALPSNTAWLRTNPKPRPNQCAAGKLKKWRWPKALRDLEWDKAAANNRDLQDLRDLQATIPQ